MMDKEALIVLGALIWKYGDIAIDEDTEEEFHFIEISYDDFLNFGFQTLEVSHDDKERKTYYRMKKAIQ